MKQAVKRVPALASVAGAVQREINAALSRLPLSGEIPGFTGAARLSVAKYSNMEEYLRSGELEATTARDAQELELTPSTPHSFEVPGRCAICDRESRFACDFAYPRHVDDRLLPNWRESLLCSNCGFRNRIRGALHVLLQDFHLSTQDDIFLTEQLTRVYRWLKGRFPNAVGSEYIAAGLKPGTVRRGVRHEDLQRLSFPDESFDLLVSFDVLEHVPHVNAALAEMCRVIRPGGRLYFTAPMVLTRADTLIRAVLQKNGHIKHLQEPEYHGDPSNPAKGALCFRHFGWQILDDLRYAGFEDAYVITWWDIELGYLQYPQYAITATRPVN